MNTDPQTDRPEADDPRVLALAKTRQQMAHQNPFNVVCLPWDGLTEQERQLSLLDARNYLRAALDAGLVPAAPVAAPPTGQTTELAQEVRRLRLMVDEYGAGASALTDKLKRARDLHRETCIAAKGDVSPTAFTCGMCEVLDTPAALPAPVDQAAVLREAADAIDHVRATLAPSAAHRYESGLGLAATELRRLAAETPGPETQGAQLPCQCGHGEAYHDFKYGGPRCRLCPESGEWTWRHAFRSAVVSQPGEVDPPGQPVHARPGPDDNGISPCCGRPPFEFRGERLTRDPAAVTCTTAPAVVAEPGKENDRG